MNQAIFAWSFYESSDANDHPLAHNQHDEYGHHDHYGHHDNHNHHNNHNHNHHDHHQIKTRIKTMKKKSSKFSSEIVTFW